MNHIPKSIGLLIVICLCWINGQAQYSNQIEIEELLNTDTTSVGQKIMYPTVDQAQITVFKITMPPGSDTGWHKHDIPLVAYIMQGSLTVERKTGESVKFEAGSAVAEMRDLYHIGRNEGTEPLVLIAVYLGGDHKTLAIKE